MQRWPILFASSIVLQPALLRAQSAELRTMRVQSCPAADSLVGPMTKPQRRAVVRIAPLHDKGTVLVVSGPSDATGHVALLMAEAPDSAMGPTVSAQLSLWVPATSAEQLASATVRLIVTLDDSLPLDFGVPELPLIRRGRPAGRLPLSVLVSPASLAALAGAHRAEARLDTLAVQFPRADLIDINGFFRVIRCGLAPPR